jgi:hypothetical protein
MLATDRGRDATPGLALRFTQFEMRERARSLGLRFGLRRLGELPEDALRAPDSPLAKAALELAAGLCSPMLLNHAVRTYHFGSILAARDRLRLDRELLYVASVLHDLGLTPEHEAEPGSFEWIGAKHARAFAIERGMDPQRADLLHDAIALHSSVGIASAREPEIAMVHYGAGVDLFGVRLDEIPPLDLQRLLEEWPRCGFKTDFPTCLERQVELKPDSHIAGAMGLGLAKRVRTAPFAD